MRILLYTLWIPSNDFSAPNAGGWFRGFGRMPLGSVTSASFSGTVVLRLMNGQENHTGTRRNQHLLQQFKMLAETKR